ncbi:arginine--tRNA ligase [Tepidiforma flava]|uniref:Arginine--tRNA ligase n=1 Tax=Tepidiforma flava TaxID=3004094 RepID=A0ABY7M5P7_9CHLR|nr:arginine--tRNA ligase [Tepidiforma flava]WBL35851.1 arginine--tRNA ligase [Tepidiforma flava]
MPDTRTIRPYLEDLVAAAARAAVAAGDLPDVAIPGAAIERPKDPANGDFASTLPLRLARAAMRPPLDIARAIVHHLPADPAIEPPAVAPPGFINFRLSQTFLQDQVEHIIAAGPAYADLQLGAGRSAQVEFVSANPTGPLHVGNGRGAAIGDALANALAAAGYRVEREYYINDAGTQTDNFAETLYARYQQLFGRDVPLPEDGYPGAYMVELAEEVRTRHGDAFLRPPGEPVPPELARLGIELMVGRIRTTLENFGVRYDRWYSERSLYEPGGAYEQAMAILREAGMLVERDGALWFASSELGEDKDNVVVRSDGRPTYYASDIAYHWDKFLRRGFDLVIDVWGADHHGHVSRLKTATKAVGADPEALQILLYQLVTLKRGGEVVRLSKRSGEIITLDELVEEVGPDAARFFFLLRSPGAQMDFDLDLAVRQSSENPVYYVQYAHARLCSILERAREQGLTPDGGNVRLLTAPHELALIREMMQLADVIENVATRFEPQHLPHYAQELATAFHAFNDAFKQQNDPSLKVITDDPELSRARLRLVLAARIALARVLGLMGMSAPERM